MKILKLTNTPECLRIALAFVGSPVLFMKCHLDSVSLLSKSYKLYPEYCTDSYRHSHIMLPLETLKICPFLAMREGLIFDTNANGYGKQISNILSVENLLDDGLMTVSFMVNLKYTITKHIKTIPSEYLDLDWIQTIHGASIEEV